MLRRTGRAVFSLILVLLKPVRSLLFRQGRWKIILVSLSIIANGALIGILLVAYYELRQEAISVPGGFRWRPQGPIYLCEFSRDSDDTSMLVNTIAVAFKGSLIASFQFSNARKDILQEVSVYDRSCRPWLTVDTSDGTMIYNVYYSGGWDPNHTLRDTDADGVPDRKIQWEDGGSFRRIEELQWEKVNPPPRP